MAVAWDLAIIHWRGDGLDLLDGAEQVAAQEVLDLLSVTCLDHPVSYYLFARHWRVTSVRFMPRCPAPPTFFRPYQVTVTIYTFFGLPLQQVTQTCAGEILCYDGLPHGGRRLGAGVGNRMNGCLACQIDRSPAGSPPALSHERAAVDSQRGPQSGRP